LNFEVEKKVVQVVQIEVRGAKVIWPKSKRTAVSSQDTFPYIVWHLKKVSSKSHHYHCSKSSKCPGIACFTASAPSYSLQFNATRCIDAL